MVKLTNAEIKQTELELLKKFDSYCTQHGLEYVLAYGTLLGAIRHKGFIPWDDDIDVMMVREDYDKFLELQHAEPTMDYCCADDGTSGYPFIKILDTSTVIRQKNLTASEESHLWIDVFPLDHVPASEKGYMRRFRLTKFLHDMLAYSLVQPFTGDTRLRALLKTPVIFLCRGIGRHRIGRWLNNYCKSYRKETGYRSTISWNTFGLRCRYTNDLIDEKIRVPFEDGLFLVPKKYHEMLTQIYGNYMELPPESERYNHQMTVWKEEGAPHE